MNVKEALQLLEQGKSIRVRTWPKISYIKLVNGELRNQDDKFPTFPITLDLLLSDRWATLLF